MAAYVLLVAEGDKLAPPVHIFGGVGKISHVVVPSQPLLRVIRPRNGEKFTRRRSEAKLLGISRSDDSRDARSADDIASMSRVNGDVATSRARPGLWGDTFGEDEEAPLTRLWRRAKSVASKAVAAARDARAKRGHRRSENKYRRCRGVRSRPSLRPDDSLPL